MDTQKKLQPQEIKHLSKVINQYIASKTSSALSKLLSEPVKYNVMILEKEFFNFRNIKLASDEIKMCTVRLSGKGDVHMEICYVIKMNYAQKIAAKLLCEEESEKISELGTSAIEEVANILTGSFFNALSAATGFRIELSTPDYQQGNLSSLANGTASNILKPNGNTVIADAELVGNDSGIRIHMLIMQQANNARKLLEQIKKSQKSDLSSIEKSKLKLEDFDSNNSELDSLVDEILQNEGERNQ